MSAKAVVPLIAVAAIAALAFGGKAKAAEPTPPTPTPPTPPTPPGPVPPVGPVVVAPPTTPPAWKPAAPSTFTDENGVMWSIKQVGPSLWTGDAPPAALHPAYGSHFFSGPDRAAVVQQIRERAAAAAPYMGE